MITSRVRELVTQIKDEENCEEKEEKSDNKKNDGPELPTLKKILTVLNERSVENKGSIQSWAWIVHDKDVYNSEKLLKDSPELKGKPKPTHIHVVMKFTYNQDLERIVDWFGVNANFFDKGKGRSAFEEKLLYLTHKDEKQQALGKHRYDDSEVSANFNYTNVVEDYVKRKIETLEKYGKSSLSERERMRFDVLMNGKTLKQALEESPLNFADDCSLLKKLRGFYLAKQKPPALRINLYICGSGGVGKDLMAKAIAKSMFPGISEPDEVYFQVGAEGSEFEGYDGQPVLIWSDYRAQGLIKRWGRSNLFNGILEPFQENVTRQNIKYSSIALINTINIFTGPDSWETFLNGLVGEYTDKQGTFHKKENKAQSYRRFPIIIPVQQETFDILLNVGFMFDNQDWLTYNHYKRISGSFALLNSKLKAYPEHKQHFENKMIQPIKDTIGKVEDKSKGQSVEDVDMLLEEFKNYGEEN